ncbi:MAG TPA: YHS domain-containing protein [Bryobacteraceae bacterium]|nr:YHS domain-containing protein [Bryobacteraceae bacterium]
MEESWGLEDYSRGVKTISVDPVCGKVINEATAAGHAEFAGQYYYFCSRDCKVAFEEEPAHYIGIPHPVGPPSRH